MFNLEGVASLSHNLENLLDSMRLDKVALSPEVVDALGQGVQNLLRMVRAVAEGKPDTSVDVSRFLKDLEELEKGEVSKESDDLSAYISIPEG